MSSNPQASLDPTLRKHLGKAAAAVRGGDPSYAISVCEAILEKEPGCVGARRVLRQAQRARAAAGWLQKLLGAFAVAAGLPKASARRRKDPSGALVLIEKALTANPDSPAAHRLLGTVALDLDLPETAVFAFEDLCRLKPEEAAAFVALGKALSRAGRYADAVRAAERALRIAPADSDAQALLRDASVAQTMDAQAAADSSPGTETTPTAAGARKEAPGDTEASLRDRIAAAERAFAGNPADVRLARQIAADYARLGEPAEARRWIGSARGTGGGTDDESLERLEFEYGEDALAQDVASARDGGDPSALAAAEAKLDQFRREGLARLCRRYPGDGELRLRLGELLLESGDGARAAPEFQAALRDARVRAPARLGLGRSFFLAGKPDLAREQLEQAREAHPAMDERGKSIRYALAQACEALGDKDAAAAHFKALYAADVAYRDVAERVARYY
ncbi:MAG: tetratricopeptide repeat protein [Opitutales bacterium]|nr:tetratricopeptide repeat protein [Opitutales bacterium]